MMSRDQVDANRNLTDNQHEVHVGDVEAWLRDRGAEVTPEQFASLWSAFQTLEERWPGGDDADANHAAAVAAYEVIVGERALEGTATSWCEARDIQQRLHAELTGAIIVAVPLSSERQVSRDAGVTRETVRKARGKPTSRGGL